MYKEGYYSSGQFAKMAGVTLRTLRYYDSQHILKPALVTETGCRFYNDENFARLQQILILKYLGFSLEDIREMTVGDLDLNSMENSLQMQLKLVRDRVEKLKLVEKAIGETINSIQTDHAIDWNRMKNLIRLTGDEENQRSQYQNASNISARIRLHQLYSQNPLGWFPWILKQCGLSSGMNVLEAGCGNGALWKDNAGTLPGGISVLLSDISIGMLRDARRNLAETEGRIPVSDGQRNIS
ncbi:MAG: MerR family transcriptional regulator, partial [Parasporobacterium sp.]|nr:MerR family transcriptional regulator [Parasporobacterium sp.]